MRLKDNTVKIQGARPELLFAIMVASYCIEKLGFELVITSIDDAKHSLTSLHNSGCAFDMRLPTKSTSNNKMFVERVKVRLCIDYDVVLEKDHIHIEYQPRRR